MSPYDMSGCVPHEDDVTLGEGKKTMEEVATVEPLDALRLSMEALEAKNVTMRPIVLWMAKARWRFNSVTMIESRPHSSLKRGSWAF